jgi:IS5 family transposase
MIYKNKTSRGGCPNVDIVIMIKLLVLPRWFGLSDPELDDRLPTGPLFESSLTLQR